ncbi:MAG: CRISPR-associated endoribonuclease Cas6 [Ignavibacteriae bacterium]|nr:CRISPR-associated endoribonuclease Cas6 [Ignavibacteriota bacterium]
MSTRPVRISLNYQYYLSAAIYKWIETSSPEYSAFLHDKGFHIEGTIKRFKHFCFSRLLPRQSRVDKKQAQLLILSSDVEWYISMPVERSLQHLVTGMFEKREFFIEREENRFVVEQVETLPDPQWERSLPAQRVDPRPRRESSTGHAGMKFTMLSPLTVSTMHERNGKLQPYYLRPDDARLAAALQTNIVHKYESLYGAAPEDAEFRCSLDQTYIERQTAKGRRITQKITIKEGRTDASEIIGFTCPITIEGNPVLIALAYESGLGEKNSLGFGMLEIANDK